MGLSTTNLTKLYTVKELELPTEISFPYIEEQIVCGHHLRVYIEDFRSEDWYGFRGWKRKVHCPEKAWRCIQDHFRKYEGMLKWGDVVFDCGANEGYYSLLFAKIVGEAGHVFCFEPDPRNVAIMQKTFELSNVKNATIIPKALVGPGDPPKMSFGSEVINGGGERIIEVDTCLLDEFAGEKPNFVKCDVEGYELPLVRGALEVLKCGAMWDMDMHLSTTTGIHMRKRFGFDPDEIFWHFRAHGYDITYRGQNVKDGDEPDGAVQFKRRTNG